MWSITSTIPASSQIAARWKELLVLFAFPNYQFCFYDKEGKLVKEWKTENSPRDMIVVEDELWCDKGREILVFNLATGHKLPSFRLREHTGEIICFAKYNEYILSSGLDGHIKFWNPKKKICIKTIPTKHSVAAICKWNENIVFGANQGGFLRVIDSDGHGHSVHKGITQVTVVDDFLLSCASDYSVKFWNSTGVCLKTIKTDSFSPLLFYNGYLWIGSNGKIEIYSDINSKPQVIEFKDPTAPAHSIIDWGNEVAVVTKKNIYFIKGDGSQNEIKLDNLSNSAIRVVEMVDLNVSNNINGFQGDWIIDIPYPIPKIQGAASFLQLDSVMHKNFYLPIAEEIKKIEGFELEKIEFVKNLSQLNMFHSTIEKIEIREKFHDFQPNFSIESNPVARAKVLDQLNELAKKTRHNRLVRVLRVWHGTSPEFACKISQVGFANLSKKDEGWFGKGIYFSSQANYSLRYCKGNSCCLMLCFVIATNPYPVIIDDASSAAQLTFYGKGNYKNYGCHYAPVIPYGDEKNTSDFRPPEIGYPAKYDEIVIFQEDHILPRFIVHLKRKTPVKVENPHSWGIAQVCQWIGSLGLSQDYSEIIKKEAIDGPVLCLMGQDDFKSIGIVAFGDWKKINSSLTDLKQNFANFSDKSSQERQVV